MKCDRDKPQDIYKGEHSPGAVAHFHLLLRLLLLAAVPGCAEDVCGATGSTILWPSLLANKPRIFTCNLDLQFSSSQHSANTCALSELSFSLAPLLLSSRSYHRGSYFRERGLRPFHCPWQCPVRRRIYPLKIQSKNIGGIEIIDACNSP